MELNNDRRGRFDHMEYLSPERVHLTYEMPLAEIVLDYYDQLKSRTRGYASFDYDVSGFQTGNLARVDILVGGEPVDALSLIIHREFAYERGKSLVEKLREEIPRQMFDVAIQAAIGARIIARETVKARRKDVLAKCYGGDISRKRKLLEKQKKGKKRMKSRRRRRGAAGGVPRGAQPEREREEVMALEMRTACERCGAALDPGADARDLLARVHVLPGLRRGDGPRLPELRRRARRGARAARTEPCRAHGTCTSTCRSARRRCGYCDFVTVVGHGEEHGRYVEARPARARARAAAARPAARVDLPRRRHTHVDRALRRSSTCCARCPMRARSRSRRTPRRSTPSLAALLRRSGVDRVSLGGQTFDARLLRTLDRAARRPTCVERSRCCATPASTTSRST